MQSEVSIVIPCYNAEKYVGEAIESALNQTYELTEVIVIDDGSTDSSLDVIRSFDEQITWRTGENHGACHARNWGAEFASGNYLMFLDADDLIAPRTLSALVEALRPEKDAVAACPWHTLMREEETWQAKEVALSLSPPQSDPIYGWLSGWYIPCNAILWPREVYEQTGGWDEQLHANQDGDIMLRAFLDGTRLVQASGGKAYYRSHGASRISVSSRPSVKAIRSRARVLKRTARRLKTREGIEKYAEVLGEKFYGLARKAALVDDSLYAECLRLAEQFAGVQTRGGTLAHRVLSDVLGLQRKEKLAAKLGEWGIGSKERLKSAQLHKLNS